MAVISESQHVTAMEAATVDATTGETMDQRSPFNLQNSFNRERELWTRQAEERQPDNKLDENPNNNHNKILEKPNCEETESTFPFNLESSFSRGR